MSKKHTTPPAAAPTGTQKIVFLRSHPGYAYFAGNRAELADEHAVLLIQGGFAEPDTSAHETTEIQSDETR